MHPAALAAPPKARKAEGLAPLPLPLSFHWQWLIPLLKHPPQPHVLSTAIGGGIAVDEGVEAVWIQRRTRSFCRVPLAVRSKRYPGVSRPARWHWLHIEQAGGCTVSCRRRQQLGSATAHGAHVWG